MLTNEETRERLTHCKEIATSGNTLNQYELTQLFRGTFAILENCLDRLEKLEKVEEGKKEPT